MRRLVDLDTAPSQVGVVGDVPASSRRGGLVGTPTPTQIAGGAEVRRSGRHGAAAAARTVRRYTGLPVAVDRLAARRASEDVLLTSGASAGRLVRPGLAAAARAGDSRAARGPESGPSSRAQTRAVPVPGPVLSVGLATRSSASGRSSTVPPRLPGGPRAAAGLPGSPGLRPSAGARSSAGLQRSAGLPGSGAPFGAARASAGSPGPGAASPGHRGATIRRAFHGTEAVAGRTWSLGIVSPPAAGATRPWTAVRRQYSDGADARATLLGGHRARGVHPAARGAGPRVPAAAAAAPTGLGASALRTAGSAAPLLGLHRSAGPSIELAGVTPATRRPVMPPRSAPSAPSRGGPAPAVPGVRPLDRVAPAAPPLGEPGGRGTAPAGRTGVPSTLAALVAAEAAGAFSTPGGAMPAGVVAPPPIRRTIEGADMSTSVQGRSVSASWSAPDDPDARALSPEVMDDLVDRVVERIEGRVVEELERRGRRGMPGVF